MKKLKTTMIFVIGIFMAVLFMPTVSAAAVEVNSEDTLKQALANGETEITLTDDIVLVSDVHTHATRSVGLEVKGEGTITINGGGHTLSSALVVAVEVRAAAGKTVNVVFNNITIVGAQRAIDIRSKDVTLDLNKANLSVTSYGNYQALTVGGSAGRITVNVNDSVIDGGKAGYGIITFNPVDLNIVNSEVKGYAALYMKESDGSEGSAGSVVTIKDSVFEGNSQYSGSTDNFGTIVLNDKNITINIKDTVIKSVNTGTAYQVPFVIGSDLNDVKENEQNQITIEGNSEIIINNQIDDESLVLNYDNTKMEVVVKAGVKSNVEIKEEFLETGVETVVDETTGEVTVVKRHNITLGSVANGTVTLDKENALPGETVTITAEANKDYTLDNIVVLDANGNKVDVKDGKFVMPDSATTVKIVFVEVKNPNTADMNVLAIVSMLVIGVAGLGYTLRKRFN
ncbi:MAG: hypothetical protein IJO63_03925 [Bacilli bacterium]|nr:hypothetical protein [Bacilli bacterium]